MSIIALDRFLALLERSKLVPPDQLATLIHDWKAQARVDQLNDARACSTHLVESGVLTRWQCHKLLDGRHRGFFLGRYKLLDHLGSGGMSNVYLAEHVLMQRRVAIKVLPHHLLEDATYLKQFQLEGQAAAALDHPNIVRAYDLGCEDKIYFLAMEYVDGPDLYYWVRDHGPLPGEVAAEYIAQAAAGLDHAHHAGLVHRDIKPSNLLIDRKGTVKILDMGLARFTHHAPSPEAEGHVVGTVDYLAPEQAANSQTVDPRADLYSLGCTLYFLLSGHAPFPTGSVRERVLAHRQAQAPAIELERPEVPEGLLSICAKMMEKRPENRYQSAREVEQALRGWLATRPTLAVANYSGTLTAHRGERTDAERPASSAFPLSGSHSEIDPNEGPPSQQSATWTGHDTEPNLHRVTVTMPTSPSASGSDRPPPAPSLSAVFDHLPAAPPICAGDAQPPSLPQGRLLSIDDLDDTLPPDDVISSDLQDPTPSAARAVPLVGPWLHAESEILTPELPAPDASFVPPLSVARKRRRRGSWFALIALCILIGMAFGAVLALLQSTAP